MPKIYVMYRPEDSRKSSQQILEILNSTFGAPNVKQPNYSGYLDVYQIEREVQQSDFLIVVIGRYWIDIVDEGGMNLLRDVYDPVHMAIATAIRAKKMMLPILVDGGAFPNRNQLPPELRGLALLEPLKFDDEKTLKKELKARLSQPTSLIPDFLRKPVKTSVILSPKTPDKWREYLRLGVLPTMAVILIVGVMVLFFLPVYEEADYSEAPAQVLLSTDTPIPGVVFWMPSPIAPLESPTPDSAPLIANRILINRNNAMQLGRTDIIEDTLGTVTDTFDFSDNDLFAFISSDLQELYIQEVSTNSLVATLSTEPQSPVAVAFSEDGTMLYVLMRDGDIGVWTVVPD